MNRVGSIRPLLVCVAEMAKVRCEGISVKEYGMVLVNGANSAVYAVIKCNNASLVRICGFIKGVISSNPLIVLVVCS